MIYLLFFFVTISTFLIMEGVTWLTHKYVMHGFGWYFHEDHHQPKYENIFEKNDVFFLIFATPSILLFIFGINPELNFKFFIGLGIFLYGLSYFLIHDVLIHRRFNWFEKTNNSYLKGLRKAHKIHHKNINQKEGQCFGLLYVPKKYFKTS